MIRTLDADLDTDLAQYSRLLWQHSISHRIIEHEARQVVLVARQDQIASALSLYQQWVSGVAEFAAEPASSLSGYLNLRAVYGEFLLALRTTPLTLVLTILCIVLQFVAPLQNPNNITALLMYPDFSYGTRIIVLSHVLEQFSVQQFFRLLSPILLHGGAVHLVFNMLWLWELGKRIERLQHTVRLAAAIILIGMVSNTVQYLYGGGNNFGGMSGVVYGLFAYIWMWQLFAPRSGLNLPVALIVFMFLSLVVMTVLNLSMIANEAHLGGFLCGILWGAITAISARIYRAAGTGR